MLCRTFIEIRRERRHLSTLERHLSKFRRLCHENPGGHSNPWHGPQRENSSNTCITTYNQTTTSTDTSRSILPDNQQDTICENWVRNMSKTPLTEAEESLLGHGPNFVMVPKDPPTCDYIAATEKACQNLSQGKVKELRGRSNNYLWRIIPSNLTSIKKNTKHWKQLKKDNTRMVLTADKGGVHGGAGQGRV